MIQFIETYFVVIFTCKEKLKVETSGIELFFCYIFEMEILERVRFKDITW